MGLIKEILLLPAAPIRMARASGRFPVWVTEKVAEQAEQDHYGTGAGVRRLHEIAEAREEGRIDEEEAAVLEGHVLDEQLEAARDREQGGLGLPSGPSKT